MTPRSFARNLFSLALTGMIGFALAAPVADAALLVYEGFQYGEIGDRLHGQPDGVGGDVNATGLDGTWQDKTSITNSDFRMVNGSLSFGDLPTSGNHVAPVDRLNNDIMVRETLPSVDLGSSSDLWFSILAEKVANNYSNGQGGFVIGNQAVNNSQINKDTGSTGLAGFGFGPTTAGNNWTPFAWDGNAQIAGDSAMTVGVGNGDVRLLVGYISFNSAQNGLDEYTLYDYQLNNGSVTGGTLAPIASTIEINVDESLLDTLSLTRHVETSYDEIRIGTTLGSVLGLLLPDLTWDGGNGNWTADNWNSGSAWQDGAEVTFNTAGSQTITLVGSLNAASLDFAAGGSYLIDDSGGGADSLTLNGDIHTAPGVAATLSAPVALSAAVQKTGAGTLEVNGAMTGEILAVSEGAIKGSGSIAGLVIGTNATLEPGNSPGSMSVGELTFEDQAGMVWEFASASLYDQVFVDDTLGSGDLTFEGEVNLTLSPFGGPVIYASDVFTLFTYDGILTGFDENATFSVAYGGDAAKWVVQNAVFSDTDGAITLTGISYIPEPSTILLAGLGLLGVCFRRRR